MEFVFVLVNPKDPRNIGSCARSMKTMGFSDLRIVGSPDLPPIIESGQARALAHGSADVLESIKRYSDLETALQDIDITIGTTARHRREKIQYFSSRDLPKALDARRDWAQRVALVFGCESTGLTNSDLTHCDIVTTIPSAVDFPSFNLSQAVTVLAYECAQVSAVPTAVRTRDLRMENEEVNVQSLHHLKDQVCEIVKALPHPDAAITRDVVRGLGRLDASGLALVQQLTIRLATIIKE